MYEKDELNRLKKKVNFKIHQWSSSKNVYILIKCLYRYDLHFETRIRNTIQDKRIRNTIQDKTIQIKEIILQTMLNDFRKLNLVRSKTILFFLKLSKHLHIL